MWILCNGKGLINKLLVTEFLAKHDYNMIEFYIESENDSWISIKPSKIRKHGLVPADWELTLKRYGSYKECSLQQIYTHLRHINSTWKKRFWPEKIRSKAYDIAKKQKAYGLGKFQNSGTEHQNIDKGEKIEYESNIANHIKQCKTVWTDI